MTVERSYVIFRSQCGEIYNLAYCNATICQLLPRMRTCNLIGIDQSPIQSISPRYRTEIGEIVTLPRCCNLSERWDNVGSFVGCVIIPAYRKYLRIGVQRIADREKRSRMSFTSSAVEVRSNSSVPRATAYTSRYG